MMVTSFTKADPRSQTPSLISGESGTLFQASVCAMRKRAALLTAVRELIRPQAIPFAIGCPPPPDRKTTDRHISRRRRTAAPLSFDLGAQLEHVLEAPHVEFRVLGDAVGGICRHRVGLRRDVRRELEPIG